MEWSLQTKKRRVSTSRERAVIRDILTEKHHKKKPSEVLQERDISKNREQDVPDRLSFLNRNFGCENSGQCKI